MHKNLISLEGFNTIWHVFW